MAENIHNNIGTFVGTTNVWDVSEIYQTDVKSPEFKELLVRLYQNLNLISTVLNLKDTGYYDVSQFINGQLFFPNPAFNSSTATTAVYRQVMRLVVNFGALPNTGTKSVPHGIVITGSFSFTRIYGAATDQTDGSYIPLPYASPILANNIELYVDNTNVNITTGANRSNYTICYIVLEFIQT